jgi:D-3-phosphoglycerate dehydrogenase / 2-oxoglutarate reductase
MTCILVLSPIHEKAIEELKSIGDVVYEPYPSTERLDALVKDAKIIVLRSGVNLTRHVIRNAERLRIIARAGVGVDNIDMGETSRKGITVFNIPGVSARSVAELTLGLMLSLSRKLIIADGSVKQGLWRKHELMGSCLTGKTIGIIGFGKIGREVAKTCRGLDMNVVTLVREKRPEVMATAEELGVKIMDLDNLLRESDFVTIHVPLTGETKGMISSEKLSIMKPTAFVINMAREGIVDENALHNALKEKIIAGAALDVFDRENTFLFELENIVLTPHLGSTTFEVQEEIGRLLVKNIKAALNGGPIENVITLACA